MKKEEEDKYVAIIIWSIIAIIPPLALGDSISYYVNGTSWLYEWFGNTLYNPENIFWIGLIGIIVEISIGIYYLYRKNLLGWLTPLFKNPWFKSKPKTRMSKKKEITVFISYASEDLNRFRIPDIANYLESQPEIKKVYYWERDNDSSQTLVEYMEESILKSDIFIAISSQHSLASSPVKKETEFAVYKEKRIIPIHENIKDVREFIRINRMVKFNSTRFNVFLKKLKSIITGD